jgi:hypothetical protein
MTQEEDVILHPSSDQLRLKPSHLTRHDGTNGGASGKEKIYNAEPIADVAMRKFISIRSNQGK